MRVLRLTSRRDEMFIDVMAMKCERSVSAKYLALHSAATELHHLGFANNYKHSAPTELGAFVPLP